MLYHLENVYFKSQYRKLAFNIIQGEPLTKINQKLGFNSWSLDISVVDCEAE